MTLSNTPANIGDVKVTQDWIDEMFYLALPRELQELLREAPINLSSEDVYRSWLNARDRGLPTHYVLRAIERHVVDVLNKTSDVWPAGRPPLLLMPRNELWRKRSGIPIHLLGRRHSL